MHPVKRTELETGIRTETDDPASQKRRLSRPIHAAARCILAYAAPAGQMALCPRGGDIEFIRFGSTGLPGKGRNGDRQCSSMRGID